MKLVYTQISIEKSNRAFNLKDELKTFGIQYDFEKKIYYNHTVINDNDLEQLEWFCKKHDLNYTTEVINENSDGAIKINKYKVLSIDKNNFIIELITNKLKCYFISVYSGINQNEINILDIIKSLHLKLVLPEFKSNDYLFEILNYLTYNKNQIIEQKFDKSDFFLILPNLIDIYSSEIKHDQKIQNFKYATIGEISIQNKGDFLCNCVPGLLPESEFKIVGNKIFNTYTKNYLSNTQEKKIWEYLYKKNNRKFIGTWREPTLQELFKGNKLPLKDKNGVEFLGNISDIKNIGNKLEIKIFNGEKEGKVAKLFDKDELFEIIKKYNR